MRILGIETATIVCGAAVAIDGALAGSHQLRKKNAHAESIMQLIDASLEQAKIHLDDLDAVAVSIGPGSFTGLRIGLSVAKGLCFSLGVPLVAVPTLSGLAYRAYNAANVRTSFLVSAVDARRDEVYCRLFHVTDQGVEPFSDARDLTIAGLAEVIYQKDVTITGDAVPKLKADGRLCSAQFVTEEYMHCDASAVALLGEQMAAQRKFADAKTCEPVYLKEVFMNTPN